MIDLLKKHWWIALGAVALGLALWTGVWEWLGLVLAGGAAEGARQMKGGDTVPERDEAEQAPQSHDVERDVSDATSEVANSDGGKEKLSDELDSLADELEDQRTNE